MLFRFTPFVFAFIATVLAAPAQARLVDAYTYQDSMDKSALVVIATPVTKTSDTQETAPLPGINHSDANGKPGPLDAVGVETVFSVDLLLKGPAVDKFTLHHYREAKPESAEINGPALVSFDPSDSREHSYLLFLTREPDGRYAPAGGQTDPGLFSVQPLVRDVIGEISKQRDMHKKP